MTSKTQAKDPIYIRKVSRLLAVKLTEEEIMQAANELADTVQEIDSEEDRQKNIKDQLKARLSELVSKQSRLALKISRKEEYRDVDVKVELQPSGQVSETRTDTGAIVTLREPTDEEKQLPLDKQT